MKKTTYMIIGMLILVVVLQIVFFLVLRSTGEPWDEYLSEVNDRIEVERFDYSKDKQDVVAEDTVNADEAEAVNENYITSLVVPGGDDIEVVIRVKNSKDIVKSMDWLRTLTHDSISVNTLMLNVAGEGTMNVKIEKDR